MTGRDILVWILVGLLIAKIFLWYLKRRERLHAYLSLGTVAVSQTVAWVLALHPRLLDRPIIEHDVFALEEWLRYPLAIAAAVLDCLITILVFYSRTTVRKTRIEQALIRCSDRLTLSEYSQALLASHLNESPERTKPDLEMIARDSTHPETKRRAEVVLGDLKKRHTDGV